jgi:uncharacterized membrane protein
MTIYIHICLMCASIYSIRLILSLKEISKSDIFTQLLTFISKSQLNKYTAVASATYGKRCVLQSKIIVGLRSPRRKTTEWTKQNTK